MFQEKFRSLGLAISEVLPTTIPLLSTSQRCTVVAWNYFLVLISSQKALSTTPDILTKLWTAFTQEEVFSSSFAAAGYLQSIGFPADKKVSMNYLFLVISVSVVAVC